MMMQGIRKAGQGLLGKIVIAIMFGFLIISFAIWGVGDIFRGYGRNEVAKVGNNAEYLEYLENRVRLCTGLVAKLDEAYLASVREAVAR